MKFSLIIPAYDEEKRIEKVIKSYLKHYTKRYGNDFEIIIVIDGTDNTLKICKKYSSKFKNIKIDYSKKPKGKGTAIIRGFRLAKGDVVGFTDADDSVEPSEFDKLIDTDADCTIASRKMEDSKILKKQSFLRQFGSWGWNRLVNLTFSLNLSDTQCGAKVLKSEVVKKIIPELRSSGFEFDIELLWRIKKNGFEIKEVPIIWAHQEDSSFSIIEWPKMFIGLLKLRIGM